MARRSARFSDAQVGLNSPVFKESQNLLNHWSHPRKLKQVYLAQTILTKFDFFIEVRLQDLKKCWVFDLVEAGKTWICSPLYSFYVMYLLKKIPS